MRDSIHDSVWVAFLVASVVFAGCLSDGDAARRDTILADTAAADPTEPVDCTCEVRMCGLTPCGGHCGSCPYDEGYCHQGRCFSTCQLACDGRNCGVDGCGGVCGECGPDAPVCDDGVCVAADCPVVGIHPSEGETFSIGRELAVSASTNAGPGGKITAWRWTLRRPDGPAVTGPDAPSWTVKPLETGRYLFTVSVTDEQGVASCRDATREFIVLADGVITPGLLIELTWTTPGDLDETDTGFGPFGRSAGSDLDLHLLHPSAVGYDVDADGVPDGWFDLDYDAYAGVPGLWNPDPVWIDPPETANDGDGAGPEFIAYATPGDGHVYRVGVHYWDDHGYGPSTATVRIFVRGELTYTSPGVSLDNDDLWSVASVAWPSGEVVPDALASGAPVIHRFARPFPFPPP